METKNDTYSKLPLLDMLAKGELPTWDFGFSDDTYYKFSAMLIISFVIIILFAGLTFKKYAKYAA